ncbi:MAG TPA: hypothetical protein VNV44_11505 [Solirubrobacteraceae bacterium]|nr:hypothetical protein [Solirubrobacteraceae bacterium]
MTRTAVRGGLALLAAAAIACALLLCAVALAATPKKNAQFKGTTDATPIEGFHAPVKFAVAPDSKSLSRFTFGSFGCFGAGGFRPGVNPYTGSSLIDAGKLKVPSSGKFTDHAISRYTVQGQTTTTNMTISGRFSTPKSVSGTITFSQVVTGAGVNTKCGPAKLSYTAKSS